MKTQTNNMKTILLSLISLVAISFSGMAQTTLPTDATGKVSYRFSLPVEANVSEEEAYTIAQGWFANHTASCNRTNVSNENLESVNTKSRAEVNTEFKNATPLQSLDPSSNRMTAKVITKYFGGTGSNIHVIYLQYYLTVRVENHQLLCEVSDIRYNHFNERSYRFQRVLNWSNTSALDAVNTIEYLVANQQSPAEFNKFYSFLNTDVNQLFNQLTGFVKANQSLTQN